jgi:hypothetical protein
MNDELKHLRHATEGGYEGIDFFACVVKGKRSPYRSRNTKPVHERLCTVMACTYSYTKTVEQCSYVEMMNIGYVEGDDSSSFLIG